MTAPLTSGHHDGYDRPAPPALVAVQGEVQAEQTAREDGAVKVHLGPEDGGIDVWVPPRREWRNSSMSALFVNNFQRWADCTLTEKDAIAWEEYDPTIAEVDEFLNDRLPEAMGDDPGKQGRSKFGSRGTRRR